MCSSIGFQQFRNCWRRYRSNKRKKKCKTNRKTLFEQFLKQQYKDQLKSVCSSAKKQVIFSTNSDILDIINKSIWSAEDSRTNRGSQVAGNYSSLSNSCCSEGITQKGEWAGSMTLYHKRPRFILRQLWLWNNCHLRKHKLQQHKV